MGAPKLFKASAGTDHRPVQRKRLHCRYVGKVPATKSRVFALEKSEKAAEYCRRNIEKNRVSVTLLQDDAISPSTLETGFDLIVSNPPYIPPKDREKLQKELSYEPEEALFAEERGAFFFTGN